jgi:butyryl-CoA dehydrogenase
VEVAELEAHAMALGKALQQVSAATQAAWATGRPQDALANAVPYMQAFGHTVLAWIWLDVAVAAFKPNATQSIAHRAGIQGATAYFYDYELPKITAWLTVVETRNLLCANLPEEAF